MKDLLHHENTQLKTDMEVLVRHITGELDEIGLNEGHVFQVLQRHTKTEIELLAECPHG